jgi:hypothetical protein
LRKVIESCPSSTVFDVADASIKHHTSMWINSLNSAELNSSDTPKKVWVLNVAADVTKIPSNIDFVNLFDVDMFMLATMTRYMVQVVHYGLPPMKSVAAHPQTTNERCDEYSKALLECASDFNCCHIASIH